jgi:hypothetical protein
MNNVFKEDISKVYWTIADIADELSLPIAKITRWARLLVPIKEVRSVSNRIRFTEKSRNQLHKLYEYVYINEISVKRAVDKINSEYLFG